MSKKITEAQAIEATNTVVACSRQIKNLESAKAEAETIVRTWYNQQITPPAFLGDVDLYSRRSTKLEIPNHVLINDIIKALPETCIEKKLSASAIASEMKHNPKLQKILRKFDVEVIESSQVYCKAR